MESDLLKALHQNEATKEGRMGSEENKAIAVDIVGGCNINVVGKEQRVYKCGQGATCRYCRQAKDVCEALDAKDAEIERLKEYSKGAFQHRHELYCNANHNELPGGDACSCPAGKEIRRLRKALSDQVGVNRELRYSPITDGTINVDSLRQELAEAREKNRRINDDRNKLLSQLAASEEKRKVLGAECQAWRKAWQDVPCSKPECSICLSTKATDAVSALEAP